MTIGFCLPLNEAWNRAIDGLEQELAGQARIIRGVDACLAAFGSLDAVVANPVDRSYYEGATNLKAVFVPFVGVNQLPSDLLLERGIETFNCHGNAESVAERALALALAGFGRIIEYHNDLRNGRWHGFWIGKGREDFWHSMFHSRCAVLGTGAIGQALARLLKAFDCTVIGYRRHSDAPPPPHFDGIEPNLADAVAGARIVFVTLPLTDATRALVGRKELEAMRGAFLVNVGRGDVVVEEDLYEALKDGTLAGAGLDVWYTYPANGEVCGAPSRFPIHELPNVILSPHVAGSTHEAVNRNVALTVENVVLWARTGTARHRVDLRANY